MLRSTRMGRAELLLIVLGVVVTGCRDPGNELANPGPPPRVVTSDAGATDARRVEGLAVRPLGIRPPGSGGTPVALDPRTTSCVDPAVGVWVAKTYAAAAYRWHDHRLSISRDDDDELQAAQTTRIWNGGPDDGLPPVCPAGGLSWGVYRITDHARFGDGILHVWGVAVDARAHSCDGAILDYNLDSFTGRVDRDVYTARNNDGSEAVNRPYHFRRIACAPD